MGGVGVLHAYVCVHVRSTAAYDVCSVCYEAEVSWEAPTMRIIAKPKLTLFGVSRWGHFGFLRRVPLGTLCEHDFHAYAKVLIFSRISYLR